MLFISSCGETGSDDSDTENPDIDTTAVTAEIDMTKYREFDMSEHELSAIIMIPITYHKEEDEDGVEVDRYDQPDIVHNDGEAKWEIRMPGHKDRYWHMVIEDWGDEARSVDIEKTEHEDQKVIFDFIYLDEGDGFMRYSKVLKGDNTTMSETDAKNMPNHHFYCVKNIQGSAIVLRSFEMDDFREISVKEMLTAAKATKEA